jgi:hypothetical protein
MHNVPVVAVRHAAHHMPSTFFSTGANVQLVSNGKDDKFSNPWCHRSPLHVQALIGFLEVHSLNKGKAYYLVFLPNSRNFIGIFYIYI